MGLECLENGRRYATKALNWVLRRESPIQREDTGYTGQYYNRFHEVLEQLGAISPSRPDWENVDYPIGDWRLTGLFSENEGSRLLVLNVTNPSIDPDPLVRALRIVIVDKVAKGPYESYMEFISADDYELRGGKKEPLRNAKARPFVDNYLSLLSQLAGVESNPKESNFYDSIPLEQADVKDLDLQLTTPPLLDKICVFIRDPKDTKIYWYRKIEVKRETDYLDVGTFDLGIYNLTPIPEEQLNQAMEYVDRGERTLAESVDIEARSMQAAIGVARYNGETEYTLAQLVLLAGLKYYQIRSSAFN